MTPEKKWERAFRWAKATGATDTEAARRADESLRSELNMQLMKRSRFHPNGMPKETQNHVR